MTNRSVPFRTTVAVFEPYVGECATDLRSQLNLVYRRELAQELQPSVKIPL